MAGKEGEFVRVLRSHGYVTIRSPSSGSRTDAAQPDLMFAHPDDPGEIYAVEHKATTSPDTPNRVYVEEREVAELRKFAQAFDARVKIVARFSGDRTHHMVEPDDMSRTASGAYVLDERDLQQLPAAASFSPSE